MSENLLLSMAGRRPERPARAALRFGLVTQPALCAVLINALELEVEPRDPAVVDEEEASVRDRVAR